MECNKRLAIIGGGSAYAPGLIDAILKNHQQLPLKEIRLFDIQQDHLQIVTDLCQHLAAFQGADIEITAADSLPACVKNCDMVLNTTRPGGFAARQLDESIPLEFGIPGQETVGPGGFFFAQRSVPQALELWQIIQRYAPEALLLNYTNPTNIIAQTLYNKGATKLIAMCDQADDDLLSLAESLGYDQPPLDYAVLGLNHASWYSHIQFAAQDVHAPIVPQSIPKHFDAEHRLRFSISCKLQDGLESYWPNSYLSLYFEPEAFVRFFREQGTRSTHILKKLDHYYQHFIEQTKARKPKLVHHRGSKGWGDLALQVVSAIHADKPVPLVLNLPNNGTSDLFQADTIIESRYLVSQSGIQASGKPSVPVKGRELLKRLEEYQHATVEAALDAAYAKRLQALTLNPLVESQAVAKKLLDRALAAYGGLLP